jgi:hypothetical protein
MAFASRLGVPYRRHLLLGQDEAGSKCYEGLHRHICTSISCALVRVPVLDPGMCPHAVSCCATRDLRWSAGTYGGISPVCWQTACWLQWFCTESRCAVLCHAVLSQHDAVEHMLYYAVLQVSTVARCCLWKSTATCWQTGCWPRKSTTA